MAPALQLMVRLAFQALGEICLRGYLDTAQFLEKNGTCGPGTDKPVWWPLSAAVGTLRGLTRPLPPVTPVQSVAPLYAPGNRLGEGSRGHRPPPAGRRWGSNLGGHGSRTLSSPVTRLEAVG